MPTTATAATATTTIVTTVDSPLPLSPVPTTSPMKLPPPPSSAFEPSSFDPSALVTSNSTESVTDTPSNVPPDEGAGSAPSVDVGCEACSASGSEPAASVEPTRSRVTTDPETKLKSTAPYTARSGRSAVSLVPSNMPGFTIDTS